MSFGHFSTDLINGIEGGFRNEKHRKQWRSTLAAHAALLTDMSVDEISTDDVLKVLQPIWLKIPETASRVRSRIERILDAAKVLGHRHGENPARWKGHLEFILPKKGRAAVKHHAACLSGPWQTSRSNETIGMTWREIDRDKRVWKISSSRTKSGTFHMVPLSEAASAVLDARRTGDAQPDDYVFEGPKGGPLSNMSMLMLLRRMQYGAITVHGFRSSFRDWARAYGIRTRDDRNGVGPCRRFEGRAGLSEKSGAAKTCRPYGSMGLLLLRSALRDAAIDGLRLVTLTRSMFAERLDIPEVGFAPQLRTFKYLLSEPESGRRSDVT